MNFKEYGQALYVTGLYNLLRRSPGPNRTHVHPEEERPNRKLQTFLCFLRNSKHREHKDLIFLSFLISDYLAFSNSFPADSINKLLKYLRFFLLSWRVWLQACNNTLLVGIFLAWRKTKYPLWLFKEDLSAAFSSVDSVVLNQWH